jgi:hypothetical protein
LAIDDSTSKSIFSSASAVVWICLNVVRYFAKYIAMSVQPESSRLKIAGNQSRFPELKSRFGLALVLSTLTFVGSIHGEARLNSSAKPVSASAPSIGEQLLSHHWVVDDRKGSSPDNASAIVFSVMGSLDKASDNDDRPPLLVLAWADRRWKVILFPADRSFSATPTVAFRWDSGPAEADAWLPTQAGLTAMARFPEKFIRRLLNTRKLVSCSDPGNGASKDIAFEVSGLRGLIAKYPEALSAIEK